jgi:outer membrane protein OmpA-like peptidoglycan-associated protein
MGRTGRRVVTLGLVAPLMAACVRASSYHRDLAQTRAELAQERQARQAADSAQNRQIADVQTGVQGVKTDVQGLRSDLQTLRTEFGAKITALSAAVRFDVPVNFAFDDATVRDQDHPVLDRFASVVDTYYPGATITVEGFADPAGTTAYNRALSERRATAVRDYLTTKGVPAADLKTVGYGKSRLVMANASHDEPGAEENRRVTFVIETRGDNGASAGKTTASAAM